MNSDYYLVPVDMPNLLFEAIRLKIRIQETIYNDCVECCPECCPGRIIAQPNIRLYGLRLSNYIFASGIEYLDIEITTQPGLFENVIWNTVKTRE